MIAALAGALLIGAGGARSEASSIRSDRAFPPETQLAAALNCASAAAVLSVLRKRFGEVPAFIGNLADGSSVVLTQRTDDGSWTLLAIGGSPALACEIASGVAAVHGVPTT